MANNIGTLSVSNLVVEGFWDHDDELEIDTSDYGSTFLNREQAEKLRDHLTFMLEMEQ